MEFLGVDVKVIIVSNFTLGFMSCRLQHAKISYYYYILAWVV